LLVALLLAPLFASLIAAKEGQKEDLYESLKVEIKQLNDELDNTISLFSRLATEAEQNQTEMNQLLLLQACPPRRDPTPDEKITTHERQKRARNLAGEMRLVKHKEQVRRSEERSDDRSLHSNIITNNLLLVASLLAASLIAANPGQDQCC